MERGTLISCWQYAEGSRGEQLPGAHMAHRLSQKMSARPAPDTLELCRPPHSWGPMLRGGHRTEPLRVTVSTSGHLSTNSEAQAPLTEAPPCPPWRLMARH